jgi:hypothetical protein
VQCLLVSHMHQLLHMGEAAYIVDRREIGRRQSHFLYAVQRFLQDKGTARRYHQPWPRGAASHVVVVTLAPEVPHARERSGLWDSDR